MTNKVFETKERRYRLHSFTLADLTKAGKINWKGTYRTDVDTGLQAIAHLDSDMVVRRGGYHYDGKAVVSANYIHGSPENGLEEPLALAIYEEMGRPSVIYFSNKLRAVKARR